jgi:hypothetical protein
MKYENVDYFISEFNRFLKENSQQTPKRNQKHALKTLS